MRYTFAILVAVLLVAATIAGCLFEDPEEAVEPAANLQATIDAALARLATTPANATPSPTPTTATAPPTDTPTPPPTDTPAPTAASTAAPVTTVYDLTQARNWDYLRQTDPTAAARLRSVAWIADGLQNVAEFNGAERLVNIAIPAPDTFAVLLDASHLTERLAPLDLPALLSLQRMAQDHPQQLAELTRAAWFHDGLTDTEAAIVAVLYERSQFQSPEFGDIVRDPATLSVELNSTTNRAGEEVPIAIIRPGSAPPGSPVLSAAQSAVPIFEEMFDAPFPASAIVFHVTDYVAGVAAGTNFQTHVTLKSEIDANERPEFASHAIFHEIAHYYLYARPAWYAEGGADFAASYALRVVAGAPIEATNAPCAAAPSLAALEKRLPPDARMWQSDPDLWLCNYALGERLMLALYRKLGEERFLQGWRELYGELAAEPSYPSRRDFAEVDLRVAWLRAGGMEMQPELEEIWDQWYRGQARREISGSPDPTPADPALPSINGRIDQAYIALSPGGPAVQGFAANQVVDWVYLTLEYSYPSANTAQQLPLTVVEYFEDGFTSGRRTVDLSVKLLTSGGTQWLSVGPAPPRRWAPGHYWVYVYEGERKVAEVEFGVTP